jgi:hypothetical protein
MLFQFSAALLSRTSLQLVRQAWHFSYDASMPFRFNGILVRIACPHQRVAQAC